MGTTTDFASTAALMGDPVRAQILEALMGGQSLTASELSRCAGVSPQTASGHLAQLVDGGMLAWSQQGRFRYYRIASTTAAYLVEELWSLSGELAASRPGARAVCVGPRDPAMRFARVCYDHLAGSLGVQVADSLVARGLLDMSLEGASLTAAGVAFFRDLGVPVDTPGRRSTRVFCRPCLDWSERRPHLAGAVGAALCTLCLDRGWLRRTGSGRALMLTPDGHAAFRTAFPVPAAFVNRVAQAV